MNDTEKNDITVDIEAYDSGDLGGETRCYGNKACGVKTRRKLPLAAKLFPLWSLLFGIVVGVPFIFLMAWLGDDVGVGAVVFAVLIFVCIHTTVSVLSFRRYRRKYGVREWQFAFMGVLPLLAVGVILYLAAYIIGDWSALIWGLFGVCFGGYSVVYGVILFIALGIEHSRRG